MLTQQLKQVLMLDPILLFKTVLLKYFFLKIQHRRITALHCWISKIRIVYIHIRSKVLGLTDSFLH